MRPPGASCSTSAAGRRAPPPRPGSRRRERLRESHARRCHGGSRTFATPSVASVARARSARLGHDFDGVDALDQRCEQRRGVARAGADLERPIGRLRSQRVEHERDHARLADGLSVADGKRAIFVGAGGPAPRTKRCRGTRETRRGSAFVVDAGIPRDVTRQALALVGSIDRSITRTPSWARSGRFGNRW